MKSLFRITILLTMVVVLFGVLFDFHKIINSSLSISLLACIFAGIKAIRDPLNFDWVTPWFFEVDKELLKPHEIKIQISNTILGIFMILTSLFL